MRSISLPAVPNLLLRAAAQAFGGLAMVVAIFLMLTGAAMAGKDKVFTTSGVAIRGYDPVAYFTDGKPVKGKAEHTVRYEGAKWQFASKANAEKFKADPVKYAPQYGGYCAWAVSQGYTASIDPQAWKVVDGKLYLNYSKGVQSQWQQDIPGNITKADSNWPGVLGN